MDFVIRPRGGGKTKAAIAWLKDNPGAVLIVHDESYAATLRKEFGLTDKQVMSHRSAGTRLRGRNVPAVGVDNLDLILADLLGTGRAPVGLVTATGESV